MSWWQISKICLAVVSFKLHMQCTIFRNPTQNMGVTSVFIMIHLCLIHYRTLVTSEKGKRMTFIDKYNIKQQVSLHVPHGTVIGLPQRVAAVNNMSYWHRVEGTGNTCTLVLELDFVFVGGMNLMKAMQNWRAEKFSIPGHKYEMPVLDASVVAMDEVHHGNDLQVCVEKALVAMGKSPLYRFMIQRI